MTERVNLVDAYDNRSVVSKLVNMEERISGAETSVEASAEAAATSASKAAVSQTAAKTSEANAKASADAAAATLSNTVDLSSKQTITGAKTFAGDTTVTGQLISSGTNTLSGTTELEGTVELDSTAVATLNGKVTASNTGNSIKVANHDTALVSNDVLSAKDINEVNGDANNLVHRSGNETFSGVKTPATIYDRILGNQITVKNTSAERYTPIIHIDKNPGQHVAALIISRFNTVARIASIINTNTTLTCSGWPGKIALVSINDEYYYACKLALNDSIAGLVTPSIRATGGWSTPTLGVSEEIATDNMVILLEEA